MGYSLWSSGGETLLEKRTLETRAVWSCYADKAQAWSKEKKKKT
jgi:hypothetical protein